MAVAAVEPIGVMAEQITGLSGPPRDERELEEIARGFEKAARALEEHPEKGLTGTTFSAAEQRAETYGLTDCHF